MKTERIRLERVRYMPKDLEPGVLYVAEEFGAAAHLCACGCGSKIRTPLSPTDWTLAETPHGPTLRPSVGNWQRCQSHYWIRQGQVLWSDPWTPEQIAAGRREEAARAHAHYDALDQNRGGALRRFWHWLKSLVGL